LGLGAWGLGLGAWRLGLWALGFGLWAHAAFAQDTTFVRDTNVAVPMRDGVKLRADIWRPRTGSRFPTLVYRTPYGKTDAYGSYSTARKAVARGYAVVLQDVRGRYASGGEFLAYQQEGRDGYDTIEWAARQPWSNGSVGTFGLSYPGAVQWLAAIESPPSLKAMVPAMTFASPAKFWYFGGVWDMSWIPWVSGNIAPDRRRRLGLAAPLRGDSVSERRQNTVPLVAMKDFETVTPWYYDWLRHPPDDPWWSWAELKGKYIRTTAAVLNFSGWYDEAYGPHGAVNNYLGLVQSRRKGGGNERTGLIIGPWSHGIPRPGGTTVGDRVFGPQAAIDYDETVLRWMDRYVRNVENGVNREKPVRIFVLGSNVWIESNTWPLPGMTADTIRLQRRGESTTIVSDPNNPVIDSYDGAYGPHDYRALAERKDVVVFESPPLDRALTVVGAMTADIHISVDAPDTDIWVKIHDVSPDGTAFNLMSPGSDVLRASYRNGKRALLQPGRVYRVRIDDLFTANTFLTGHRIRVVIATTFFPNFSRNLHTGLLETTSGVSRTARVTVHHSDEYPSRLILPVVYLDAILSQRQ